MKRFYLKNIAAMKKHILLSIFLLLCTARTKAQITLDNDITPWAGFGDAFYLAQISETETKYVFLDTLSNTFSLYNMDFTPFMENIIVPEPFKRDPSTFFQPVYITRTLFDCDSSNIEYAYQSSTNSNMPFRIVRTDGTVLFARDSANGVYCIGSCLGLTDIIRPIRNTSDGAKLYLQHYDDSTNNYQQHILVYSLCGNLPSEVFDFSPLNQSWVELFPNPASSTVNFKINIPDNINSYELVIFDKSGREISRKRLSSQNENYSIDVSSLSSGGYSYALCTKMKVYQTGKFILTK